MEPQPPIADLPLMDFIDFATGMQHDCRSFPGLRITSAQHPIHHIGGLPCLTKGLMWNDDVPLLVTGALARLRKGAGTENLGGARLVAERITLEQKEGYPEMQIKRTQQTAVSNRSKPNGLYRSRCGTIQ